MSASVMLKFEAGEIKKVKEWFGKICPADRYPDLPIPESPYRPKNYTRGIYVDFSKNIMILDYAIWDEVAGCYATKIGQQLNKKFKIKDAGWDSVGYYKNDFMKSTGLLSYVFQKKALLYKDEHSGEEAKWRKEAEVFFEQKAKELVGIE